MFIFQKNTIIFERFECVDYPNATLIFDKCDVRRISRRNLKFDIASHITKPVNSAFIHSVSTTDTTHIKSMRGICGRISVAIWTEASNRFFWTFH